MIVLYDYNLVYKTQFLPFRRIYRIYTICTLIYQPVLPTGYVIPKINTSINGRGVSFSRSVTNRMSSTLNIKTSKLRRQEVENSYLSRDRYYKLSELEDCIKPWTTISGDTQNSPKEQKEELDFQGSNGAIRKSTEMEQGSASSSS